MKKHAEYMGPELMGGFCTLTQALACAVDECDAQDLLGLDDLHVVNERTGQSFLCEARIAHGYVAACRVLWPDGLFGLKFNGVAVEKVVRHHHSVSRLMNPWWREDEGAAAVEGGLSADFEDTGLDDGL